MKRGLNPYLTDLPARTADPLWSRENDSGYMSWTKVPLRCERMGNLSRVTPVI